MVAPNPREMQNFEQMHDGSSGYLSSDDLCKVWINAAASWGIARIRLKWSPNKKTPPIDLCPEI